MAKKKTCRHRKITALIFGSAWGDDNGSDRVAFTPFHWCVDCGAIKQAFKEKKWQKPKKSDYTG